MRKQIICLVMFLLLVAFCGLCTSSSYAAIPHLINYQGRLTDTSGNPLTGSYTITFRIYDAETAGTLLWEETQVGVVIDKGLFGIMLGSVTALNISFDRPYYLEIKVGTDVMTPRQRITSAGYAMRAEVAESLSVPGKVGTKEVDETGLTGGMRPYYDGTSGKVKYNALPSTGFGSWVTKSNNTVYQAETDGFVCAIATASYGSAVTGWTDSSNPPTTKRVYINCYNATNPGSNASIMMPVKKGDYWKVSCAPGVTSVYWIPMGS